MVYCSQHWTKVQKYKEEKTMKKILAIALALVMVLGLEPVAATAATAASRVLLPRFPFSGTTSPTCI